MSKNRIQFQKGLSISDFLKEYGTEEQCFEANELKRWSKNHLAPGATAVSDGLWCALQALGRPALIIG